MTFSEISQIELKNIGKVYKASPDHILKVLKENFDQSDKKLHEIEAQYDKIARTRVYKEFIKKVKKQIYYELRTYYNQETMQSTMQTSSSESSPMQHVSTREREAHANKFFDQIDDVLKNTSTLLDLGGGIFPTMVPFEKYPNITKYYWVDKDKKAFEILNNFAKDHNLPDTLILINKDLRDFFYDTKDEKLEVDTILMLKLIPIIYRQDRDLIEQLAALKTNNIIVTANKESLAKNIDISRREDKILKAFIELTGRKVEKKFEIETEFGYILTF